MAREPRVPLYERLPEIYRVRDAEQQPPQQLEHYLSTVERAFGAIHENIRALYDDLFIETCDDWAIPYIGDLLGVSHLSGEAWTRRADVADTIALRRRKGTLAAIERLTYDLTRWGVHCVELRDRLVWTQHLNHQRPDMGGDPPYARPPAGRFTPVRGGTLTVRDPAMLSLLGSPFDPFAHTADLKPPMRGHLRYNLPNLAIFLWRLAAYRVERVRPVVLDIPPPVDGVHMVRVEAHPLGRPVRLFNTYQFAIDRDRSDAERDPFDAKPELLVVTELDRTPGPIPRARLMSHSPLEDSTAGPGDDPAGHPAGRPEAYLAVDVYDPADGEPLDIADVGLQLHLPAPEFTGEEWPSADGPESWRIRGADLRAWHECVWPAVEDRDIVVDPETGRVLIGVADAGEAAALKDALRVTYSYGAVGPVGAHPISRDAAPDAIGGEAVVEKEVGSGPGQLGLEQALDDIHLETAPVVIEITDSEVYDLDIEAVSGRIGEDGGFNLRLRKSLIIRAAGGERPIVRLARPLRFRALDPADAGSVFIRLEGLHVTRDDPETAAWPLIARAAVDRLEVLGCTLDPGGWRDHDGDRSPMGTALELRVPYGFGGAEADAFEETPDIVIQRSVTGRLHIDRGYTLRLTDSIVDAGRGVGDDPDEAFAVSNATDPLNGWGPPTRVHGITVFGRMRVETIDGRGGIWVHALEVLNNQRGCIRYSYFSGVGDRLPQNIGCVTGVELRFVSEVFGEPAYGQLAHTTDARVREHGPGENAMGAFGFLQEAHKWRNIQIRFREFMPVGVRPLLIPVT